MHAAFALRLLVSVLLTSRSTCALLGGCTRRATALDHRRGVQLTAVEMESSDTTQIGSLPAFGDVPQDLAADQIVPDEWNPDSVVADGPGSFVEIFRSSTPYIKMHRASTMVIHIDTRVLDEERLLADLMDDVALITVLGVLPVLVISIRDQVDTRLREMDVEPRFHGMCMEGHVYVEPSLPQHMHIEPHSYGARRPSTVDRAPTPRKSGPEPQPSSTPRLGPAPRPLAPRRWAAHLGPCGDPGAAGGLGLREIARRGGAQPRARQPRRGRRLGRRGGWQPLLHGTAPGRARRHRPRLDGRGAVG